MVWYGDKRSSKVVISRWLKANGFKIHGYKEDQSDSMTDYYSPASWGGIATKGNITVVVDCWSNDNSGKPIEKWVGKSVASKNLNKIKKLQAVANCETSPDGERNSAREAIKRLEETEGSQASGWEKIGVHPVYMANPPHSNWHVEIDGKLAAKGNGAFQFSSCDYVGYHEEFDWKTLKFADPEVEKNYYDVHAMKSLEKFRKFTKKLEKIFAEATMIGKGKKTVLNKKSVKKQKTVKEARPVGFDGEVKEGLCFRFKDLPNSEYRGLWFSGVNPIEEKRKGTVFQVKNIFEHSFNSLAFRKGLKSLETRGRFPGKNIRKEYFKECLKRGLVEFVEVVDSVVEETKEVWK